MSGFICSFINIYGPLDKEGYKDSCRIYAAHLYKGVILLSEQGIIEKVTDQKATVRVRRSPACANCSSKISCDISNRDMLVEVFNDLQAKVGDRVEISIPEGTVLKMSVFVYLFPIIALIIGAFLGGFIASSLQSKSSWPAILLGMIFFGLAFCVLKIFERKKMSGGDYNPKMTHIVANVSSPQPCDSK
jgi:sigma-E factor negative regulatory protein RseC